MTLSRRVFLGATAATTVAGGWSLVGRVPASASPCGPPPVLPSGITPFLNAFRNWSGEIVVDAVWTCSAQTAEQVVELANWAHTNGYRLRPRGYSHNWSPLTIPPGTGCTDRVLLVDTTESLTAISVDGEQAAVTAQSGASMEALLTALEEHGYGLSHNPAPGDLTVGGVLAIDAHGTAIPADGETRSPGHTFGSISNLVLALTAVVWDAAAGAYVLRTFTRTDSAAGALMAHVGRAFVTSATLQVGANTRVRCQSYLDIPAAEMFAPAGAAGRTIERFLAESGRIEAIWFPFTEKPWLKVWTVSPTRAPASREVDQPFNYPFSDKLPDRAGELMARIQAGSPWLAPKFGKMQWAATLAGLNATAGWDLWGWAKNTTLYVRPTTLRVTANGYAVLCRRADIQRVIHEFAGVYTATIDRYRAEGRYPVNGPMEIRVTGLDHPGDVGVPGARTVQLSALRPRPDQPDWDCAVWLDLLTLPGTPDAAPFYREIEQWCLANYSGDYAALRVEWSKGWAYSDAAAWTDPAVIGTAVPESLSAGQPPGERFADACATLDRLDPHRIYSSPLLDTLLP